MGSSGYCNSTVSISFSYKKETKNENVNELKSFIEKNKLIKKIVINDDKLEYYFGKYNIIVSLESKTLKSKDYDTLDEFLEDIEDNLDEDENEEYQYVVFEELDVKDLEYVDLNLLNQFNIKELNNQYRYSKSILSGSTDIYYNNSNLIKDSKSYKDIEELLLLPKAKIELYTSASSY